MRNGVAAVRGNVRKGVGLQQCRLKERTIPLRKQAVLMRAQNQVRVEETKHRKGDISVWILVVDSRSLLTAG